MSTATISEARAGADAGRDSFGLLLHAEWTKFRTVRGWVIGMILAALLTVLVGLLTAAGSNIGCQGSNGVQASGKACLPYIPHGPGGQIVTDSFYFVRQPLTGNGTITTRVTSLTGEHANLDGPVQVGQQGANMTPGLMPWSKAGLIVKEGTKQGSAYAAIMVTGSNGVRMQYDYIHDTAGLPGRVSAGNPRWLRLTRSGDTITGYDSADGTHWTEVGTARLAGLPTTVQIGMFATSPDYSEASTSFGSSGNRGGPSQATGVFDDVSLSGIAAGGKWTSDAIGGGGPVAPTQPAGRERGGFGTAGGSFTLTGSGDIAPAVPGGSGGLPAATVEQSLTGVFIGLIVIVVVAAMFFTAEYRRGLIRTTLAATPRRGRVLAAKAVVIGAVAFVVGLAASAIAIMLGVPIERNHGQVILSVSALTEARVIVGTAAMLAVAAIFAVALGAALRRSAAAISVAIVAVVLPFLLSALNVFPPGVGAWLLRLTPAAGLAIQQSIPHYPQVTSGYSPVRGYYPLPPFAGFAVLCCYAAAALGLAFVLLRRRDA
jgi:ABC-type transport system involved in multi-copper enzyme maturation permease subunit